MPATRGEPTLHGSRAVQDMAYPAKHASDIEDAAPIYHNPVGTSSGYASVWDGSKYVSTDVLTPAEHTAIGNGAPHHAAVTLGNFASRILTLTTQTLTTPVVNANKVYAGPTTGADAAPDWRALVAADMPALADHDHTGDAGDGGLIAQLQGAAGNPDGSSASVTGGTGVHDGGNVFVIGGTAGTGRGGEATLAGGDSDVQGGRAQVVGGTGWGVSGIGGDVTLIPGTGTINNGALQLQDPVSGIRAVLDMSDLAVANKTFTFPNASGTFALTSDLHAALTLGANPGLVLSTQELVLGTPSTLTVSTTNAVTGANHTHAITASAAPGATESLLKSAPTTGLLTLAALTATTGKFDHIGEATGAHTVVFDNTVTLPASTIVPDGGTIGQAAGPLLTFDDTNNDLTLTGAKLGIGMDPAVELDVIGSIRASGPQNANKLTSHNVSTGGDVICSINNSRGALYTNGAYPLSFGANGTLALEVSTTGGVIVGTGYMLQDPGANNLTVQGSLAIGAVVPTARLFLPAGSATASTAPLKMTSGTLLTTAEAGAVEFLTDDYFATITTGAARKGIVLDDGARLTDGKIPIAHTNGRLIDLAASSAYTPSNVSADRSYDANSTTLDEIADVLGTLIADLQAIGVLG